jgi:hypothetical protein
MCAKPFMMINDVGLTFGQANRFNTNARGSVNLSGWSKVRVWRDSDRCVGNLPKSFTGTLENPVISEDGRQFLASRLSLLSDKQLHDLFTAARVERRKDNIEGHQVTADDWVRAFKEKRDAIVNQHCPAGTS